MEDPLGSIFNYQENSDLLMQKLLDTMLELEAMRNVKTELLNLLKMAYRERDQAREQLQNLMKKLAVPSTAFQHENNLVLLQSTKANSSITESNSPSHVSSPVDSLFEAASSPEFSNVNVAAAAAAADSHNLGLVQDFSGSSSDVASAVIDCLARGKVLPQKGKLLEAVMEAGPLLHTLLPAGPLPTWRNPPPLSAIKIPPLSVKDFDAPQLNSFPNTLNSFQCHSSEPMPMPMLNLAGVTCNNNTWQLTSNSSVKKQRHQYF